MPKDDWITVERAPIEATAQMMRSRLEIEGIDAVLRGNHAAGTAGAINELNLSWDNPLGGVEVRVRGEDAARAREILAARDDEPAPRRTAPLWIQIAAALFVAQTAFLAGAGISGEAAWGMGAALIAFGAILALGRRAMITILDYSVNNLRSVQKAFEHLGHQTRVTSDPEIVARAEKLVLPGVGAFGEAMRNLRAKNLVEPVCEAVTAGKYVMGVCLGMQLLFDWSEELGLHQGLGILGGKVKKFPENADLKVPHMGWSELELPRPSRLFAEVENGEMCYFVHSYHALPDDETVIAARGKHGLKFVAGVERDNVMGAQFHPEKSSAVGLRILDNFARL